MMYTMQQKVLFKHCDPAGIVFFPRYFEMMNDCVEAFFDEVLQWPFERLLTVGGVPTVQIETQFTAPSRHGDALTVHMAPNQPGRSSLTYEMKALCNGERRFQTKATLVHTNLDGVAQPWPDGIRAKLQTFMKGQS